VIKILDNPKTQLYIQLKEFIKSKDFTWFWHENSTFESNVIDGHTNIPFYAHTFLERAELDTNKNCFPVVKSQLAETASTVFQEILNFNGIEYSCFLRMGSNCVHPFKKILKTSPHLDHPRVEHKNILIYLNNSDGDTVVENQKSSPKEDKVIIFNGLHYHYTPSTERRIVLIATFI